MIDVETYVDDAESSKPCPDIFETALQRPRLDFTVGVIALGDTPYDAEAAAKAGAPLAFCAEDGRRSS